MAEVGLQDGKSSSDVAEKCQVEDLSVKLRQKRQRWFGHVKRAEGRSVLGDVGEVIVGGDGQQEGLGKSGVNV